MKSNNEDKNIGQINSIYSDIQKKYEKFKRLRDHTEQSNQLMKEIWELSKQKFLLNTTSDPSFKKYEGLIFTVGFAHEPIILNILIHEPKAVFFIYTKESEKTLKKVIHETGLEIDRWKREIIQKNSFESSVDLIGYGLSYLNSEKKINVSNIGLDITGGTKLMSLACGMAALMFGSDGPDILYIDNQKYDKELNKPIPGTERLKIIKNPLKTMDEHLEDKGLDLKHTVI